MSVTLFAKTVEKFLAVSLVDFPDAEEEFVVKRDRGGIDVVAEFVFRDLLEAIAAGFEYHRGAIFEGGINVISHRKRGRHDTAASDFFAPFFLTGFGVPAMGPAIIGDGVNEPLVGEERLFVANDGVFPNNLAGAVGLDAGSLFFGEAAAGEDHIVVPNYGAAH